MKCATCGHPEDNHYVGRGCVFGECDCVVNIKKTDTDEMSSREKLARLGIVALLIFPLWIWKAFVAMKLYQWFVVEQFGFQAISLGQMCGLMLLVAFLTKHIPDKPKDKQFRFDFVGKTIFLSVSVLGFGWVLRLILL